MKRKILLGGLSLLLPLGAMAQDAEALRVHHQQEDQTHSVMMDDIHRITFTEDSHLVLKSADDERLTHFDDIEKLSFGEYLVGDIDSPTDTPETPGNLDVTVHISPTGEIAVTSSSAVEKLTLFSTDGKLLSQSSSSVISAGSLPAGIYILHIETAQGNISKKIIKK